ncbi:hypothetical protein [Verrucosispora sp. NA02020]|uniref:hypothetical protein n=1 Tax=Verrucosispora sp. NA02020 TaxID=2742132 RepID=UPI003D731208
MFERIRLLRFRLRVRRANLAEIRHRFPHDPAAHDAARADAAEIEALLPWWQRIGI